MRGRLLRSRAQAQQIRAERIGTSGSMSDECDKIGRIVTTDVREGAPLAYLRSGYAVDPLHRTDQAQ